MCAKLYEQVNLWTISLQLHDLSHFRRSIPVPGTGPSSGGDVTIYIINPMPGASRPTIMHVHGGGFISGSPLSDLPRLLPTARELGLTIVRVDYDLAPEALYERSIEQNYAGLKWTYDHAEELSIDPRCIAVLGGSRRV